MPPQIEVWLTAEARQNGVSPGDFARRVIEERAAVPAEAAVTAASSTIDAENAAAIAWLEQRIADEATDDPEEIRRADEEVAEMKRNLNANRAATGERLVSL